MSAGCRDRHRQRLAGYLCAQWCSGRLHRNADAVGAWLDRVVPGLVGFELVITANTIARDRLPWRGRRETARTSSPAQQHRLERRVGVRLRLAVAEPRPRRDRPVREATPASGWSGCRVGPPPTGKRRPFTAHAKSRRSPDRSPTAAVHPSRSPSFAFGTALPGRVGVWRSGCRPNISVAAPFVWQCLTGSTVAPFPHPAHR